MKRSFLRLVSALVLIASLLSLTSCKLIIPRPDGGVTDPPAACEHQWGIWVYELEPTCSEEGKRVRECLKCYDLEYETRPDTRIHYSQNWIIDKEATCETEGEKHKICDGCGGEFARRVIPAAHSFVDDACEHCAASVDDFFTFSYHQYDKYYILTGLTEEAAKTETDIILPATYRGENVEIIYQRAFYENQKITSVTVQEGYTTIKEEAFSKCENLISVELPDSITDMENAIFKECTSLMYANIPRSIKKIPVSTFSYCQSLTNTSVYIHEGITEIGSKAFYGCKGLTKVIIPDTVKVIRAFAYEECTNITEIVVGKRVERIEWYAFDCGMTLKSIIMRNSKGWMLKAYYKDTGDPVDISIKQQDLDRPFRAALYFTQNYVNYNWERGVIVNPPRD